VKKTYLALVHGEVKQTEARIATEIGRHERDRKRMAVRTRKGREAVTTYKVMKRLDGFTLLHVHPETGRTHQIRVHLSAIGHPVVGDKVYGGTREKKFRVSGFGFRVRAERQLLHAWKLGLFHPRTNSWMECEAPPPVDLMSSFHSVPFQTRQRTSAS
jgi:23S rRNA pseudouridine1911/1915/1917 synthase